MAYTTNPHAPRVRRDAAAFARKHGVRVAARRFGVAPGTITKWMKKAERYGLHPIPTGSSRPKRHPHQLAEEQVDRIVAKRLALKRSAEVVQIALAEDGVEVSLSSVKRTLARRLLLNKRSPWKRSHFSPERPQAASPGALVEIDTIHILLPDQTRIYIYTLIDVFSRWTYALASERINARASVAFLRRAQRVAPFAFSMLQTDHGSEFSRYFSDQAMLPHRFARLGKPNDQAHIERFNRTIQEECLDHVARNVRTINRALRTYLSQYNTTRHHFGIGLSTPLKYIKCFQAID